MAIGSPHRQFCLTMIFLAAELHRACAIEKHGDRIPLNRQFCLTMIFLAADSCIERVLSKNVVIGSPQITSFV